MDEDGGAGDLKDTNLSLISALVSGSAGGFRNVSSSACSSAAAIVQMAATGGAGGGGGGGQSGSSAADGGGNRYSIPGILHYLQHEWSRMEIERGQWEVEKAELQVSEAKAIFLNQLSAKSHDRHIYRRREPMLASVEIRSERCQKKFKSQFYLISGTHRLFTR